MTKIFLMAGSVAVLFASMTVHAAGDYAAGEKKAKEICATCHGADGNSASGAFPKIAGQWESYIYAALKQYKSGERKNVVMGPQAQNLTEQEMHDAAVYFSRQKPALFTIRRK
jgi:cytochrome c553